MDLRSILREEISLENYFTNYRFKNNLFVILFNIPTTLMIFGEFFPFPFLKSAFVLKGYLLVFLEKTSEEMYNVNEKIRKWYLYIFTLTTKNINTN